MKICPYCKVEILILKHYDKKKVYCSRSCSNKDMIYKNQRNPGQGRKKDVRTVGKKEKASKSNVV